MNLLIAGGGPIGLATALHARRAGLAVTVLEPRAMPIEKACGEGLMPGAVRALAELGVAPEGRQLLGIRYLDRLRSVEARFRDGPGRGVRRTTLHAALADAARERGVRVLPLSVTAVERTADGVQVTARSATTGADQSLIGSYLIGADGLHSRVRAISGLAQGAPASVRPRWGLRRHYQVSPWTELVEVYWSSTAEAYVTPVAADQVGVAILSHQRRPFDEHLAGFPELIERLGAATGSSVRGAGPLLQRTAARSAGPVMLVGDAAGYVDALTGEGIAVGLAAAERLVSCLVEGRLADYEREWAQASRRYRILTGALLWTADRPRLRRAIVPAAAIAPRVFGLVVSQLAR
jgi:flavin-dependent dehydrogenase